MQLKAEGPLLLSEFLKYHRLFYFVGYGLSAMPHKFDMWQIVFGTYILGLTVFIFAKVQRLPSKMWDLIFCISILGIGLFLYYQGESNGRTLINVSWPAIVLNFLWADRIFSFVRANYLPKLAALSGIPILLFGVFTAMTYVFGLPMLYQFGKTQWNNTFRQPNTKIVQNLKFIKEKLNGDKQAAILTHHQAVYFSELNIGSSLNGSELMSAVLVSDIEEIYNQIASGKVTHLFINLPNAQVPEELRPMLSDFELLDYRNGIAYFRHN